MRTDSSTASKAATQNCWFFLAVFLNVFVNFGHRVVIQNTIFKSYIGSTQIVLTALLNALMLLPFIFLLAPSGVYADRYSKLKVMRHSAKAVMLVCALILVCYYMGWFLLAFGMTLLLAIQASFFSPAKYGFIRDYFGKQALGKMNGIVSALSIVAILAGLLVFSLVFEFCYPANATSSSEVLTGIAIAGWLLLLSSAVELVALYRLIPQAPADTTNSTYHNSPAFDPNNPQPELPLPEPTLEREELSLRWQQWFSWQSLARSLAPLRHNRPIRMAAIGLALCSAIALVMLVALPAHLQNTVGIQSTLVRQSLLACVGIGIAMGALCASRYSRHHIETGFLPLSALGITVGLLLLPQLASTFWLGLNLLLIGFMGGLFIVPLNALLQYFPKSDALGQTLAASNWLRSVVMLLGLVIAMLFAFFGGSSQTLLLLLGAIALVVSGYTLYQFPQSFTRLLLRRLVAAGYRIQVQGMQHIPAEGGVLLLGNHVSWIDWAVVQIASPRPLRFVVIQNVYELWYLKWFFNWLDCIPMSAGVASRHSLDSIAEALRNGEAVCLFPEGVFSRNGQLMEFRKDYERVCAAVDDSVVIIPFFLRGLWGNRFSRPASHIKRMSGTPLSHDVVVNFGAPLSRHTTADVLKQQVRELAHNSWEEYADSLPTIGAHWIETCRKSGNPVVLLDTLGTKLRAKQALTASIILSRRLKQLSPEQNIGLMLPSSSASALINMAVMLLGKTAVNLNFTASAEALLSSVEQAEIKTIYTSARFMERLKSRGIDFSGLQAHVNIQVLEDFKATTSVAEKLTTLMACWLLPASLLKLLFTRPHDIHATAVILFSSGSEGVPKGVTLTHRNLLANVKQVSELLNMNDDDVMLANLPPFHAFGLTVTYFIPLLEQVPVVCHADPTDAYGAAQAISEHKITTMFGTCSFYRLYSRNNKIHPLMLNSLRLIVAGAEKLQEDVRKEFKAKFNKNILEGYGATETAPVASVNMPDQISLDDWKVQVGGKTGSVGMPLPGTSFRIVDPQSFTTLATGVAGMILVTGAQVMPGYLKNDSKNKDVLRVIDGKRWYVTGDKGYLDEDGFLYIIDRYSRFAKISGEMIGLVVVETAIKAAVQATEQHTDFDVVVVNLPDEKKGERLIALTTHALDASLTREKLIANGLNTLALPVQYCKVEAIPKLGSGKTDFAGAKQLALTLLR